MEFAKKSRNMTIYIVGGLSFRELFQNGTPVKNIGTLRFVHTERK